MMIRVEVEIAEKKWLTKIKSPKKYLSKKIKKLYKNISFLKNKNISFTILLTNSINIKKLNKKFRKKNKSTDGLSFPFYLKKNLKFNKKNTYIGDIAISYEIINLRSKKNIFSAEFDKVWIHSFLHLLGYNHIKNKDYLKMSFLEKKIINIISEN